MPAYCPTCQLPDGSPNADFLDGEGSCCFGCGTVIDRDHGMCPHCKDHSANEVECESCHTMYGDWSGRWEVIGEQGTGDLKPRAEAAEDFGL